MIISKLSGGMGNQLFQYALGRHLAHIHSTKLKFDISGFENYELRSYALSVFNITVEFASKEEVNAMTEIHPAAMEKILNKLLHRKQKPSASHIVEGKSFRFKPYVLKTPDNVCLDGYWQCAKYFENIPEIIRKEVSVKVEQTGKNKEIADLISTVDAVSLHIRRGDYVSNPKTLKSHGICSIEYYLKSVDELTQAIKEPHFFVFSDDPQWASENLKLDYPITIVDHNGEDQDYEDLRLMSQCKHHILANSSFSWWGAWLNLCEKKIVYAPEKWFAKSTWDDRDVVPVGWHKIT